MTAKRRAPERRPMHLRLSEEERCQLSRVAARLGLSPSATIRFLINAEEHGAPDASLDTATNTYAGLFPDRASHDG